MFESYCIYLTFEVRKSVQFIYFLLILIISVTVGVTFTSQCWKSNCWRKQFTLQRHSSALFASCPRRCFRCKLVKDLFFEQAPGMCITSGRNNKVRVKLLGIKSGESLVETFRNLYEKIPHFNLSEQITRRIITKVHQN